jgi:hypothetical protein
MSSSIERAFTALAGYQLFKSWNVFATRFFYFSREAPCKTDKGDYRLTIESPWRIEHSNSLFVGSADYGVRANSNSDPTWNPTETQVGHLQDEQLAKMFGEERNGSIYNTGQHLRVIGVKADNLGGFRMSLSGDFTLEVFPTSSRELDWLLSRTGGGNVALNAARLTGSLLDGGA